ncbi:hypothetical protein H4R24_004517 [Coemansia sp. RSA 988]|nr:hypothetical protein H4R24_004517 [Coemansia sp. RSA 988]
MAVLPSFLQRMSRGSLSFDDMRRQSDNKNPQWNANNAGSDDMSMKPFTIKLPSTRHSLDMGIILRRTHGKSRPLVLEGDCVEYGNVSGRRRKSSPKFFAKITWVDTLSQLAALVPLSQINVPHPVYE